MTRTSFCESQNLFWYPKVEERADTIFTSQGKERWYNDHIQQISVESEGYGSDIKERREKKREHD